MGLVILHYDIFLVVTVFLNASDVIALSKCSPVLRDYASNHQTWVVLAKSLILSGTALPTKGFKTPDQLSPEELRESVLKAERINRAWKSPIATAREIVFITEGARELSIGDSFAFLSSAVVKADGVAPLTSDIIMLLCDNAVLIWHLPSGTLFDFLSSRGLELGGPATSFDVDLESKTLYITVLCRVVDPVDLTMLFRLNLASRKKAVAGSLSGFRRIAAFPNFAKSIAGNNDNAFLAKGQILSAQERRLCQLYVKDDTFLLYVVLDWDERSAVFIDTGIRSMHVTSCQSVWYSTEELLTLNVGYQDGVLHQYGYHLSQLLPLQRPLDLLDSSSFGDVASLPRLPPIRSHTVDYVSRAPSNTLSPLSQSAPYSKHWHTFRGMHPPAIITGFCSSLGQSGTSTAHAIGFIPFTATNNSDSMPHPSLIGEGKGTIAGSKMPLQYGAIACAEGEYPNLHGIRICRVVYPPSTEQQPSCAPRLPDGRRIQFPSGYRGGYYGLKSLSLDVVHGRVFLVYDSGAVHVLSF